MSFQLSGLPCANIDATVWEFGANFHFVNESIRSQLGYSLKQIIISCIFNNKDCDLENDFVHYYDQMYGNCFKYNADKSKMISQSGSMNGLQLELFTESASSI